MNRQQVLMLLHQNKSKIQDSYNVLELGLFGSAARDEAKSNSDIDILVTFDGPATSKQYFGLQFFLEDLFNCSVDLVTNKALRNELRPFIEKELIYV